MAVGPSGGVLDAAGLQRLRSAAADNSPESLKAAATQFEAMFLEMVMKSMRDATPTEGLFDGEQGKMMQGMLDQQYARSLASRGVGLAEVLARQMAPHGAAASSSPSPSSSSFVDSLAPHAEAASAATGIPAKFMLGQAALETGWGKREIMNADGSNSFNVFGMKAGSGWAGKVAEVTTTEYVDGVAQKRVEKFRAYGSYAEAFADYSRMLSTSPRYRNALASAADPKEFAESLQKAGYATDPDYAKKLGSVIAKV